MNYGMDTFNVKHNAEAQLVDSFYLVIKKKNYETLNQFNIQSSVDSLTVL